MCFFPVGMCFVVETARQWGINFTTQQWKSSPAMWVTRVRAWAWVLHVNACSLVALPAEGAQSLGFHCRCWCLRKKWQCNRKHPPEQAICYHCTTHCTVCVQPHLRHAKREKCLRDSWPLSKVRQTLDPWVEDKRETTIQEISLVPRLQVALQPKGTAAWQEHLARKTMVFKFITSEY